MKTKQTDMGHAPGKESSSTGTRTVHAHIMEILMHPIADITDIAIGKP